MPIHTMDPHELVPLEGARRTSRAHRKQSLSATSARACLRVPLRICRLLLLLIAVPCLFIFVPLYLRYRVFSGQMYPMSMTDMRLIDSKISTTWCQRQVVKSNATFNAFVVPGPPTLTDDLVPVTMTRELELEDDMKEYWGFYLLKGSTVTVSACTRWPGASLIMIKGYKHLQECAYIGDDSSEELDELLEAHELGLMDNDTLLEKIELLKMQKVDGKANDPGTMKRHKPGVSFHDPIHAGNATSIDSVPSFDVSDHDPKELREILERLHALRQAAKTEKYKHYKPPSHIMSLPALHRHRDANVDKDERRWIAFKDIDGNSEQTTTQIQPPKIDATTVNPTESNEINVVYESTSFNKTEKIENAVKEVQNKPAENTMIDTTEISILTTVLSRKISKSPKKVEIDRNTTLQTSNNKLVDIKTNVRDINDESRNKMVDDDERNQDKKVDNQNEEQQSVVSERSEIGKTQVFVSERSQYNENNNVIEKLDRNEEKTQENNNKKSNEESKVKTREESYMNEKEYQLNQSEEQNSREVFEDVLRRLEALGDRGKRVLIRLHETMGVAYHETRTENTPDLMSAVKGSSEELDRLRKVLVEAIDEEKTRPQRQQKRRDARADARAKRELMLGQVELTKQLNEDDEPRNYAAEEDLEPDGYAEHHTKVNETTPFDMSNSEFWSSFSSSEEALLECDGLILNLPLTPHSQCKRGVDEDGAYSAAKANALTYRVPANGYYFFVFNSENEVQTNFIRAKFDLQKTKYDVALTKLRECTNSTERCDLSLDIFSSQRVVLEVPLRNNDSLWNEQFVIISECEPRTSVYLVCVIAVPILIMVFAFQ